jgi:hypothetical protein
MDKQQPETLQWIPLQGTNNVLGVYRSVTFKRQDEVP